jgi:anion-transporting  ArsA/GET3 family ATPase
MWDTALPQRLIVLSGKGGVGKTTLSAAVALRLARAGQRVVLVTLDTRESRHPVFGVPLDYLPQQAHETLWVARVDPISALVDYSRSRLPLGGLYEPVLRSRAVRDFTGALPGFEELMLLGRLYNLAVELEFDRVVFDAPALGHLRQLIEVPAAMQRAMPAGPVHHVAKRIAGLLFDPERTVVLPVTLPEQMPVSEALELLAFCRDRYGMALGPVLINRCQEAPFTAQEWGRVRAVGSSPLASAPLRGLLDEVERRMDQQEQQLQALAPLVAAGARCVHLPAFDLAGDALVEALAHVLHGHNLV